ncbi:MAG: hypothetical protein JW838_16295 [Spirochaetes bacterium]|nr:hypothetical protein [Spirochaetota bacterium]
MNCKEIQRLFLEMDNDSRIPLAVHLHTFFCPRCRRDIALLGARFDSLREEAPYPMDRDLCERVMAEVFNSDISYEHEVSPTQWGVVGFIILMSLFLIPFSDSFGWLRGHFGRGLELPVSIVLGLAMTIFALAGVFSHMEGLKKIMERLPKRFQ